MFSLSIIIFLLISRCVLVSGQRGCKKRNLQPGTHFVQNIRLHALNSTELFTILHGDVDTLDAECLQLDCAKHS